MRKVSLALKRRSVNVLNRYFTGNSIDYKQIIAIIVPIFVDHSFLMLMTLLNTAMISSSGVAAISAVSMVESLNLFIVNMFIAVAMGGTVIVAQYRGSGNDQMVSKAASQAFAVATVLSIIVSVLIIIFHTPTLHFLFGHAEADVLYNARIFLIGNAVTYPLFAVYQTVMGVLRGVADTKATLVLSVMMNLTYFVLNLIFITFLDMGIVGLVISLILSRLLGMVSSFLYMLKYSPAIRFKLKSAFKIDFSLQKKIMYIGFPFALEQMFFNGGKLLTQTFIVQFGTLALTVNAIGGTISSVFQIGASALSVSIVTVVGQCIGRNDIQDARKFIRSFLGASVVWFLFASAIILPLFPYIVQIFSPPKEIVPDIFKLILLIAVGQPLLWSFSFILPSALRAAGDSKYTSATAMTTMWLIRIVLGYLLGVVLNMGVMGIWLAMVIEWGARGLFFWIRFKGDKWYRHKLI